MKRTPVFLLAVALVVVLSALAQDSVRSRADLAVSNAIGQTSQTVHYDPAYVRISYPGGDLPIDRGVCTDVVIRAFRAAGVDLQKEIHEDMAAHFTDYPQRWGMRGPDSNIDHRRVPNQMRYFKRQKKSLALPVRATEVKAGDLIAWDLGRGVLHIGIAVNQRTREGRPLFVHNIGRGAQLEDILFSWKILGHYRFFNNEGNQ